MSIRLALLEKRRRKKGKEVGAGIIVKEEKKEREVLFDENVSWHVCLDHSLWYTQIVSRQKYY